MFNFIDEEIKKLENENLKREIKTIITPSGSWVEVEGGKRVLQFASNNYLGLANHPDIINATKQIVNEYGVGSTGSRLLSGTSKFHKLVEEKIAKFQNTEAAILFSSGYSANVGLLSSLISDEDAVYSDEFNHASIIDGIKLSKGNKFIYKHNDMDDLKKLLENNFKNYKRNYIVTDSVFSMDGDVANLNKIAELSKTYNTINIADEAHAIGVFGEEGEGLVRKLKLDEFFPIRIGTCSKALGVEGGFCVGPKNLITYLQNKARSFMFSTSPSIPTVGAVLKSLDLVKDSNWRREKLWNLASMLHTELKKNPKLKLKNLQAPIVMVLFEDIDFTLAFSRFLFEECHIWAPAIRPPSVSTPRIRLTPIATHSEEDIDFVVKAFNYATSKAENFLKPKINV